MYNFIYGISLYDGEVTMTRLPGTSFLYPRWRKACPLLALTRPYGSLHGTLPYTESEDEVRVVRSAKDKAGDEMREKVGR
jgi:hypothetical protein